MKTVNGTELDDGVDEPDAYDWVAKYERDSITPSMLDTLDSGRKRRVFLDDTYDTASNDPAQYKQL